MRLCSCVLRAGVYVNGYRIIDQRALHGDSKVELAGDVRVASHRFRLPDRGPR